MKRLFIGALVSALLAGCGGGSAVPSKSANGPAAPTPAPNGSKSATQQVAIHLKITASGTTISSGKRRPQYVSPATNGVLVQVFASPKSANPAPIGVVATDVSPGSAACGGATGARTCTISIPAPAGLDDFVFTTYDQPPVGGTATFPGNANVLSIGVVTQTILLAGTNVVNAALGGVIASLAVFPSNASLPGGVAGNYTLAINALDSDGNAIVSSIVDPYNNPITVTVSETGGSGYASVTLGGATGTGSSSVSLAQSTQTVTVLYSGSGSSAYGASLAVSSQGVGTVNVAFAPFFVTSASQYFTAATASANFTLSGQTALVNLGEHGFAGTFTASAGASCANVASVGTPAAGATSSATITAGANAGTCTVTFSDGFTSVPVTVNNTNTSSVITIPSGMLPSQSLVVADGASIKAFAPGASGNILPIRDIEGAATGLVIPHAVALDSSGNIYATNYNNSITVYAPSANGNVTPIRTISGSNTGMTGNFQPWGITLDAQNNIWILMYDSTNFSNGSVEEFAAGANGNVAPIAVITGSNTNAYDANSVGVDPNGNIFVASTTPLAIYEYPPGSNGNAVPSNVISGSNTSLTNVLMQLAFDTSGRLWVADLTGTTHPSYMMTYAPNLGGNVAPAINVTGPSTGVYNVRGLAFDNQNNMYVSSANIAATGTLDSIQVFGPGASGNATPIRSINGPLTGFSLVRFIAISP